MSFRNSKPKLQALSLLLIIKIIDVTVHVKHGKTISVSMIYTHSEKGSSKAVLDAIQLECQIIDNMTNMFYVYHHHSEIDCFNNKLENTGLESGVLESWV